MQDESSSVAAPLTLQSVIGFEGSVLDGVQAHPDGQRLVYAVGTHVVCSRLAEDDANLLCVPSRHTFLAGHSHNVSCVAVSHSGKYIVSGQRNYMGFKAEVIIWSMDSAMRLGSHSLHKVNVVSVSISANDKYAASLGGRDDGTVIIYDIAAGDTLCGVTASMVTQGLSSVLLLGRSHDTLLVSAGDRALRVWTIDGKRACMTADNLSANGVKRNIRCMTLDARDEFVFCGTTSGDILQVRVGFHDQQTPCLVATYARRPVASRTSKLNSEGLPFRRGVWCVMLCDNGDLLVGSGDGGVYRVRESTQKPRSAVKMLKCTTNKLLDVVSVSSLVGRISSIQRLGDGRVLACTEQCHMYAGDVGNMLLQLSGHPSEVKQLVFPRSCAQLFVTCAAEDVRVWQHSSGRELLRMSVANFVCQCVCMADQDTTIVSGWNDGLIRAFCAETGQLKYSIRDAHNRGVTAVASTSGADCHIISGGDEGQVRIWQVRCGVSRLVKSFNEHRKSVTCVLVARDGDECVSASADGSCVVWDLRTHRRKMALFGNCSFTGACYGWNECQLITCGTDKRLSYWEIHDGSLVRQIDVTSEGPVSSVDITSDGRFIVTGSHDRLVKVFRYAEGDCVFVGRGHSSPISCVKISPDHRVIVSTGDDGSILVWNASSVLLAPQQEQAKL